MDKLATVVGVTLGPKVLHCRIMQCSRSLAALSFLFSEGVTESATSSQGRNVVLESKYGSPRIVNDGVTVAREVELEDPVEDIGAKLVRQAAQRTNDTAGDGTTTATILSAAIIAEVRR